jgi:hypothetical protein
MGFGSRCEAVDGVQLSVVSEPYGLGAHVSVAVQIGCAFGRQVASA